MRNPYLKEVADLMTMFNIPDADKVLNAAENGYVLSNQFANDLWKQFQLFQREAFFAFTENWFERASLIVMVFRYDPAFPATFAQRVETEKQGEIKLADIDGVIVPYVE